MSISLETMRALADGGMGTAEMLIVAEAGQRGPDQHALTQMIYDLREVDCPPRAIAIAVMEMAERIARRELQDARVWRRDEHSKKRDSNKSRRGLSNQRWQELRATTFDRDGWACVYCGADEDLTCDHVVPLVRGGTNDNENLATACRSCNSSKGDKLLSEWRVA